LLAPYRPAWADFVRPEARGAGDLYFGAYLTPAVIAYNSQAVPRDEAPQDWDDVLDPRWKGKLLIRDPLASGTMRAIFGMIIDRSLRESGDTAAGFEWLRRLDAQTKEYVLNPALLYQKLARQEGLITLWNLPDVLRVRTQNIPLDYVIPAGGTPVLVDCIAVIAGARQPELARSFIDYVGSVEGQLLAARSAFRNVTRTDLPADSLPPWLRQVQGEIRPLPIDWERLESEGREWMRHWDSHVRGASRR
jgi:iron(III) transport system substrate-binding protein